MASIALYGKSIGVFFDLKVNKDATQKYTGTEVEASLEQLTIKLML